MTKPSDAIYVGTVMHRRLRPKPHGFRYSVFSLLVDVDHLPGLGRKLRLFSHNRFNLYAVHESDLGNGGALKPHLEGMAAQALGANRTRRFLMQCYPRVLGYVFNPLTVYYGLDAQDRTTVVIYEVTNTFGERHSYAIPVDPADKGCIRQSCEKVLHVSPFNAVRGRYAFRTRLPGQRANVAILLKDEDGPLLAAQFSGERVPLSDAWLARLAVTHGFMTAKVWLGIHYEALKLWSKRLRFFKKPAPPTAAVTVPVAHKNRRIAA
ncbi:DUF1365 domain-containing protein [Nitratireductor sp. XY-223]|uniref:DUF1365 domain-containing protein n=1 Tax=Nitratireductor sp. XY-223 TaxID=2561926 RepID=UPI0010AA2CB7|nr:DUF1365 domain-containing protein [Nitratireductor sp. XY-223]